MAQARQIELSAQQKQELSWGRDHHPKAYVRSKCAGILKVAAGTSMRQVAATGLLKAVDEETVSDWIDGYQREGSQGLLVRKGGGRKPAFSPCGPEHATSQRADRRDRASSALALRAGSLRMVARWAPANRELDAQADPVGHLPTLAAL